MRTGRSSTTHDTTLLGPLTKISTPSHTLLSLDPSLAETGYALHDATTQQLFLTGTIITNKTDTNAARLLTLGHAITKLISHHHPTVMAIELPFVGYNRRTALTLGTVRGVILYLAANAQIPVHEYTTTAIKAAVTGRHTADKLQVQSIVQAITGRPITNHNESDAVAVALTHFAVISSPLRHVSLPTPRRRRIPVRSHKNNA